MKFKIFFLLSLLFLTSFAAYAQNEAKAVLFDNKGKKTGEAFFKELPGHVELTMEVTGLTPGGHAVHIHENGKCNPPDFKSAGPHFNPSGKMHGRLNPDGQHAGDLPTLFVNDGKGTLRAMVADVTLSPGGHSLLKEGGTSIVVHARPDDDKTDPSGNSGDRILCGVIS